MKVAITGKGGVGKSTLAAILAHLARKDGKTVLAVDADPDANLAFALGIPENERSRIVPISQRTELIEERTGAKLKQFGQIFKLNPHVADVADLCGYRFQGINLLVLGAIEAGGSGCACPENVFLKNLLSHIVLVSGEFVIADMEAGIEHLGRGTARGVDLMLVVVEPTIQSTRTAQSILQLAAQISIPNVRIIGNKIGSDADRAFLGSQFDSGRLLGHIPYSDRIRQADRDGIPLMTHLDSDLLQVFEAIYRGVLAFERS